MDIRVVPAAGCEAIARQVFEHVNVFADRQTQGRVWLERVEVREHAGNSASYEGPEPAN
jgi:6-pyruvoyltetrahydropterin/6-carboxytetrahydropterin synthase